MEFGTIPKYYAFDASNEKMKALEEEGEKSGITQQ